MKLARMTQRELTIEELLLLYDREVEEEDGELDEIITPGSDEEFEYLEEEDISERKA